MLTRGFRYQTRRRSARRCETQLDREPNTSILDRFDLPVIGHYFPEYTGEMRRRFGPP
jgi:hypothetical protein